MASTFQPPRQPPAVQQILAYEQDLFYYQQNPTTAVIPHQPLNDAYYSCNRYESDMQKYQALAGKALAHIQTTLTATQVASISHIFGTTRDNRTKAMQIMLHFRQCYGYSTMANTNPIKDEMDSLPDATDASSAEFLVAGLTFWNHCLALMDHPTSETDSSMIARLFKKLKGAMFDLVALQINELNHM